ncbi:MAG: alpha/beta hydrolase [Deltaproteobacteria bacterium]|nr:alpha/beta hydrolase [Deltaproteobacteria bacterium]MBN2670111.1 alpha/beta hydrolase [Deltaproteobacteria bacterium]
MSDQFDTIERIVHTDTGEGPMLLFIPGLGLNTRIFTPMVTLLKQQFRCVCIEFSGPVPPGEARNCSIESLAAEVNTFLRRRQFNPHCVIGHSLGGFIAMRMTLAAPDLVPRMVLLASAALGDSSLVTRFMPNRLTHPNDRLQQNIAMCVSPNFASGELFSAVVSDQLHHSGSGRCFVPLLRAATRFDIRRDLPRIAGPTLIICGEADPIAPIAQSELLLQHIPGARLVCLPKVAHLPQVEAPTQTADAVIDFLQTP